MIRKVILFFIGLILLGGLINTCSDENLDRQPQPEDPALAGNLAHREIQSMSSDDRARMFERFFVASGEKCEKVTETFYQGEDKVSGDAFWNVRCGDRREWVIQVKNDALGSTKILDCKVLSLVGGGKCFVAFESQ